MTQERCESVEIDLSTFDRKILEYIIAESCEKDISANKVINNILIEFLKKDETSNI